MKKLVLSIALMSLFSMSAIADQRSAPRGRPVVQGVPGSPVLGVPGLPPVNPITVSCQQALVDHGIQVVIAKSGNGEVLTLSDLTFTGVTEIGSVKVTRSIQGRGSRIVYSGKGLELVIQKEIAPNHRGRPVAQGFPGGVITLPETPVYDGFVRGKVKSVRLDHDLKCSLLD